MEFFNSAVGVCRLSWWPWAQVLVSGALSTFWKVTARTTLLPMLMCHKETRKNLIDSIHYSIATASCLLK